MSTLATLKAEIADDFARTDLEDAIAGAISRAITYYQNTDFWFNEKRSLTFTTVAGQARYSSIDDTDIGLIKTLTGLFLVTSDVPVELLRIQANELEAMTSASAGNARPDSWAYYEQQIGIWPPPDDAYTVRMMGTFKIAEPAANNDANNPWMVEAYQLIRFRASKEIAAVKIRDYQVAQIMGAAELDERTRLLSETDRRTGTSFVTPSDF